MKVKFQHTLNLTDDELQAFAYHMDGGDPRYDKPTGRRATREEIQSQFLTWLLNESSEITRAFDEAKEQWDEHPPLAQQKERAARRRAEKQ